MSKSVTHIRNARAKKEAKQSRKNRQQVRALKRQAGFMTVSIAINSGLFIVGQAAVFKALTMFVGV